MDPPGPADAARHAAEATADATQSAVGHSDGRISDDLRQIAAQGGATIEALQHTLEGARALLSAEAALARDASLRIAALTVIACIVLLGGWLCLMAALVLWLQSMGLSWAGSAAAAAALSLMLGALAIWRAARLAPLLAFPRTRRQLQGPGTSS